MTDMGERRRIVQAAVWDRLACKNTLTIFVFIMYYLCLLYDNIKGNIRRRPKKRWGRGILHYATSGYIHSPIHLCDFLEEIHFE